MNKVDPSVIRERLEASFYTLDIPSEVERHTSTRLGKPDSRKQYNGACPFDDCSADTNGFIVWPELTERGCHYWCRQCGRKGDILKLIMDIKGLKFVEACKELGIPNPYKEDSSDENFSKPQVKAQRTPVVSEWSKNELAMLHTLYPRAKAALEHERAKAYLSERAIPFDVAVKHGLGYIPAQTGAIDEKYSRWVDRIIFPIYTPAGDMGFCGRSLYLWEVGMDEDTHKAKLDAYNQSVDDFAGWGTEQKVARWLYTYQQGFFNWQAIQDATCLVFVEGPFDVLACLAAGIPYAISIGTTGVDASVIPLHVESAVMGLDTDESGLKAAKDLSKSLRRKGIDVSVCKPPAKDWSAAYRIHGREGLSSIQGTLQASVEPDSKPLEKTSIPIEEGLLAIATWMESTGVKRGSRVSTPEGLGTVFSLVDTAHVRVILDNRSDEWVKYFHSDEIMLHLVEDPPVESPPVEIKPYVPVCLLPLPRKECPCETITWDGKGKQEKMFCKHKPLENGFCSEHQASFKLLEIGATQGYPEAKIPFKWKGETLYRTIYAGVTNWECYASLFSTDRPLDIREQDVRYLERQFELVPLH